MRQRYIYDPKVLTYIEDLKNVKGKYHKIEDIFKMQLITPNGVATTYLGFKINLN